MKPKIIFYDVHPLDQAVYKEAMAADFELTFCDAPLSADNVGLAREAVVLSVHVTSPVTERIMAAIPDLRHVSCRSTGYDNVDLKYAKTHSISVSNVPAYGQETVAEYAFLLMLAVSRKLMPAAHSVQAREIVPEKLTGRELDGKTLGIIGTGRIGQHVAAIAAGFGMKLLGYDPYPQPEAAARLGFTYTDLPELLASSDYLTLHAPARPGNRHLLGSDEFDQMKTGVFIVNTARGSLIDTVALIDALGSGKVAGAGLDVLEGEDLLNLPSELHLLGTAHLGNEARQVLGIEVLHTLPNVIITAHNAYNSAEALSRIRTVSINNIKAWHKEKTQNLVG